MYMERRELFREIEAQFEGRVLLFATSDRLNLGTQIANDAFDHFVNHLDVIGVTKRIILILYSTGGHTLAAWSLINLVKQYCDELVVLIPSKALSAATLMSLGANEIVMTKQARLGPIDPSLNGPLNPHHPGLPENVRAPVSVEAINGYLALIEELQITDSSDKAAVFDRLSKSVHPLVLGEIYRMRDQIRMLARRLISTQVSDPEKIETVLQFICSESGSHDYTINRNEAENNLGLKVRKPTEEQYRTIKTMYDDFSTELQLSTPYNAEIEIGTEATKDISLHRGLIESVRYGSHIFITEGRLTRTPAPMTQINFQTTYEGWRHEHTV